MKASELIKEIEKMIKEHGDQRVYSGGTDYPEEVEGIQLNEREHDGYLPKGTFYI